MHPLKIYWLRLIWQTCVYFAKWPNVLKDTFIAINDWENLENGKYVNAMQNMREHAQSIKKYPFLLFEGGVLGEETSFFF